MTNTKIASLAALTAILAMPLAASAQSHSYGNDRYDSGSYSSRYGSQTVNGVISAANSGDITLSNGRTIFLKQGTIIDPRGQSLQPGQRVSIQGSNAGNGNLNAQSIQILGDARYGSGYDNSSGRNDTDRRRYDRDDANRGHRDRDDRDNNDNHDNHDNRDNH